MNKELSNKIHKFLSQKVTPETNDIEYLQKALKLLKLAYDDVIILKNYD